MNRSRALGPVLALVIAAAVLAGAVAWAHVPARLHLHGGFVDLSVYQYGGRLAFDGLPLYGSRDPATNLRFTYPPFAAAAMIPLGFLPGWLVTALWTAASVGALAGAILVVGRALRRPVPGWLAALLAGGAFALEPVWQNLTFGQINLLLMLAVLIDLVHPERRWSGLLVGIAAGVKLTPLVFVVLLIMVGRRSTAGRALLAFAATVAIGFAVAPGPATTYWTEGLFKAGRVGPPELAHNQSVFGALTRLLDGVPPNLLWLAVAGPLALAVVALAAVWWRRGDRVLGTGFGALAMLLASPVSWSHHWVWAVPIGLALWAYSRWAAALWTAVFASRMFVWSPWGQRREYGWGPIEHILGNAYLLAALALCLWAVVLLSRQAGPITRRAGPSPASEPAQPLMT
ncbi:glycosyltransferase 87 family protein [Paractinoplanes atraurantiacus]|uniref:Alpha-1,2-mannosyltransferase n=1 Tax=Paractinoplanes atraurantiacus TaxID=1036182 RepID=A0A285K4V0_9ACTN|nr:glycosyltransferase 87 family protein [Actinoplanes atraurantiacus]SNY67037.1 alpha-1,2-mannosyltransferase [Actinoplanes atraurantiacus]